MKKDKEHLRKLIRIIDREDAIRYLCIVAEDIVEELYGSEVLDNE